MMELTTVVNDYHFTVLGLASQRKGNNVFSSGV